MAGPFDLRNGVHRLIAAILVFGAFAGFAIMLGSVAALQQACEPDLNLSARNDLFLVQEFLEAVQAQTAANPAFLGTAAGQRLFIGGSLQSMAVLAARSATGGFSLTADMKCSMYYRYCWLATALQFFVVVLAVCSLAGNILHLARVAICSFLTVSTMMSIENAHTFLYERDFAPGVTLTRGKAFFVGCLVTCGANLLLCCVLGFHDETAAAVAAMDHHAAATVTVKQGNADKS